MVLRHRPQLLVHLQGRGGGCARRGRPARRAIRAGGQRPQSRQSSSRHRPVDRCLKRQSSVGGEVRSRTGRHLRAAGRHHESRHWFGSAADSRGRGGARAKEAASERGRMGPGHAGGAAHVAHEHRRTCASTGVAAEGHRARRQLCPRARSAGMDLCDHVQSGHAQADRRVDGQGARDRRNRRHAR